MYRVQRIPYPLKEVVWSQGTHPSVTVVHCRVGPLECRRWRGRGSESQDPFRWKRVCMLKGVREEVPSGDGRLGPV